MLLLGASAMAQSPFVVKGQCMQNPDCEADSTSFRDTVTVARAWRWSFGDGSATDTRRNPQHSYMAPGTYTVTLVRTLQNGTQETVPQTVKIGELPPEFQQWRIDTTICKGDTITLDPYPNGAPEGAKYIWYPKGDTTQTLRVDSSGCYSVEVIVNGCKIQNRINVKICMEPQAQEGSKWYFGGQCRSRFFQYASLAINRWQAEHPRGHLVHCQFERTTTLLFRWY